MFGYVLFTHANILHIHVSIESMNIFCVCACVCMLIVNKDSSETGNQHTPSLPACLGRVQGCVRYLHPGRGGRLHQHERTGEGDAHAGAEPNTRGAAGDDR